MLSPRYNDLGQNNFIAFKVNHFEFDHVPDFDKVQLQINLRKR